MLSYICESYFNSQTKNIFNSNPTVIDLTGYFLYKTPDILVKTKSINEIIINDNFPLDDKLTSLPNIKIVTINTKNKNLFNSNIITHPIANLQNIYSLNHLGINNFCNYIYNNNFLMRTLEKNVPDEIININILHDYRFRMGVDEFPINFPISTKKIRINIIPVKESIDFCANICANLPINLKKIIITYCDYSKINYYTEKINIREELEKKIKLPFGCKIIIEKFNF